jgi:Bifunctional DNA primase/polymerase, N-terminal
MQHSHFQFAVSTFSSNGFKLIPSSTESNKLKQPGVSGWDIFKTLPTQDYNQYLPHILPMERCLLLTEHASSNVCVLDFDRFDNGYNAYHEYVALLPFTIKSIVQSGNGGFHLYFRTTGEYSVGAKDLAKITAQGITGLTDVPLSPDETITHYKNAIERKGTGRYVLMPFSFNKEKNGELLYYTMPNHGLDVQKFIDDIPTVTHEQWLIMYDVAMRFNFPRTNKRGIAKGKPEPTGSSVYVPFEFESPKVHEARKNSTMQRVDVLGNTVLIPFDYGKSYPIQEYNIKYLITNKLLECGYALIEDCGREQKWLSPQGIIKYGADSGHTNVTVYLDANRSRHYSSSDLAYDDLAFTSSFDLYMAHEFLGVLPRSETRLLRDGKGVPQKDKHGKNVKVPTTNKDYYDFCLKQALSRCTVGYSTKNSTLVPNST